MKVSFVLLAHEKPEYLRDLIETLLASGSDIYVHYDASSPYDLEAATKEWGLERHKGKIYFADRVKVVWGEYSIVKGTLNALKKAREHGYNADYFMLISGSCMPVKPIWKLEEYLAEEGNKDFIESVNALEQRWVKSGIQRERWEFFHFFNWRYQRKRFDFALRLQERLGIKRKLPLGHTPHMGSQWWALRQQTVDKILSLMDKHPSIERFYKRTWVPDELFFQTMVGNLVPRSEISDAILTRYTFNSWGVPRVYYIDDLPELVNETTFFARKISHRDQELKKELRRICLLDPKRYAKEVESPDSKYKKAWEERKAFFEKIKSGEWHHLATHEENIYDYIKSIPNKFSVVFCGNEETRKKLYEVMENLPDVVIYDKLMKGSHHLCGYTPEHLPLIRQKWHLYLGDVAFSHPGKHIVFALDKDDKLDEIIEVMQWNPFVRFVVVYDDTLDLTLAFEERINQHAYAKTIRIDAHHLAQNLENLKKSTKSLLAFDMLSDETLRHRYNETLDNRYDVIKSVPNKIDVLYSSDPQKILSHICWQKKNVLLIRDEEGVDIYKKIKLAASLNPDKEILVVFERLDHDSIEIFRWKPGLLMLIDEKSFSDKEVKEVLEKFHERVCQMYLIGYEDLDLICKM